jgi:transcriptional regulator with XRE-family HTH domain
MDNISKVFGRNLRQIRTNKGLTLEQIEKITDITAFQIGRYERGIASANSRTIVKLCKGLGVSPNKLFKRLI